MDKLIQTLWKLFLVSFPFSLHLVLFEKFSYRFGHFNPWVTGIVYLPELLLILIFLLWTITQMKATSKKLKVKHWIPPTLLLLFIGNAGVVTFLNGDGTFFGFFLLRVLEAIMLYLLFKEAIIPHSQSLRWLLYGATFQVLLALWQMRLNHSIGLPFLGEPYVGPDVSNVAKIKLETGENQIRAYGTFLHPNILGAYLMTLLMLSLPHLKKAAQLFWPIVLLIGIYVTGSQAAQFTTLGLLGVAALFYFFKSKGFQKGVVFGLFAVLLMFNAWLFLNGDQLTPDSATLAERLEQSELSHQMFQAHPWGVGVGNYTLVLEEIAPQKLMPWEFQPVHNAYFLVLNETGIQGFVLLLLLILLALHAYYKKQTDYSQEGTGNVLPFLGLLVIASADHLIVTSYIGILLIALAISPVQQ